MRIALALLLVILPVVAHAAVDPCGIFSSGCGPRNDLALMTLPLIQLFISVSAGASVLFVVVGGVQMLTAFGEESKFQTGQKSALFAAIGYVVVLLSYNIIGFALTQFGGLDGSSDPIFGFLTGVVNSITALFSVVFAVLMVVAGYRMILGRGNSDEFNKGRNMLFHAAIGAILVNVARAIVLTINTVF